MKYHRQLNYRKRKRFLIALRFTIFFAIVGVLGGIAYIYFLVVLQEQSNTQASTVSKVQSSFYESNVKVFKTPYFQFQTDNTWAEIPAESTTNKFVYRSKRSNLIEHELTIFAGQVPATLTSNRVLPVNPRGNSEILPIRASDHCMKSAGGSRIDDPFVTMDRVRFKCDADSTNYTVVAGMVEGSSTLNLQRADGSNANYAIAYTNLRATPDSSKFIDILQSFQAR